MNNLDIEHKEYGYVEVNRGRYLCTKHGAYCDSSDNYLTRCPLCKDEKESSYYPNKIDRLLQIVNGLQNRSKRNLTLLASLIGGMSILRLVASLEATGSSININPLTITIAYLSVAILLLSLALYSASMAHIKTVRDGQLQRMTLAKWEQHLAGKLQSLERWHSWAGNLFGLGSLLLIIAITIQIFTINYC